MTRIFGSFGMGLHADNLCRQSVTDIANDFIVRNATGLNYTISNITYLESDHGEIFYDIEIEFDRSQIHLVQTIEVGFLPSLLNSVPELHTELAPLYGVSVETIKKWADAAEKPSWEIWEPLEKRLLAYLETLGSTTLDQAIQELSQSLEEDSSLDEASLDDGLDDLLDE